MSKNTSKTTLIQYGSIMACLLLGFVNFVACGSQLYQVSVAEDFQPSSAVNAANPDMNDPESTLYAIHAPSGWTQLPILFRFGKHMNQEQKLHFAAAIKIWEWAVGKTLFTYAGIHDDTDGDSFTDLFSSLDDNVNGQYLDGDWAKTKKAKYVLATTIWSNGPDYNLISKADIRFNHQHYIIGDSLIQLSEENRNVVDMQSLALHELGHYLGLAHVQAEVDSLSIMNPSLFIGEGLTSRKLSKGDIERIQMVYGCEGDACSVDGLLESAEEAYQQEYFLNAAQDWLDSFDESP